MVLFAPAVSGTVLTEVAVIAACVKAVVAIFVLLSPALCVVVVGLPASGTDEGIDKEYVPDDVIGDAVPVTDIVLLPINPTLVTVPLPLLLKVVQSVADKYPSVVVVAFVILNVPVPVIVPPDSGAVVAIDVTVPPLDGLLFVTVYVGKLPDKDIPVPAVMLPVAVTVTTPDDVIGEPLTDIPVPADIPALVTVPFPLPLNVVQSAEDNAPLLLADAVGRLNVCVLPDELIAKSVPLVPVAKFCVLVVKLFNEPMPFGKVVATLA
jgi:hypothetical protein